MSCRWPKHQLITNEKIKPGNVIVGLSSAGQASYESAYNSGIGSNGLTSARHDMFSKWYAERFPESFDPNLDTSVVYIGKHRMTDRLNINGTNIDAGKLVLSPTRTYAPVLKKILTEHFEDVYGLIHCSGGGQTKCLKYLPGNFKIVKDNFLPVPPIFDLIKEASGADFKEMFQVFNMGCRMEIYTNEKAAAQFIQIAASFNIDAQVIGRVEEADTKMVEIHHNKEIYQFTA
jgi:phosphoribosylformylglycinamidine cyclo-ligase